eukprot:1077047-Rhodomonas_salina.1
MLLFKLVTGTVVQAYLFCGLTEFLPRPGSRQGYPGPSVPPGTIVVPGDQSQISGVTVRESAACRSNPIPTPRAELNCRTLDTRVLAAGSFCTRKLENTLSYPRDSTLTEWRIQHGIMIAVVLAVVVVQNAWFHCTCTQPDGDWMQQFLATAGWHCGRPAGVPGIPANFLPTHLSHYSGSTSVSQYNCTRSSVLASQPEYLPSKCLYQNTKFVSDETWLGKAPPKRKFQVPRNAL